MLEPLYGLGRTALADEQSRPFELCGRTGGARPALPRRLLEQPGGGRVLQAPPSEPRGHLAREQQEVGSPARRLALAPAPAPGGDPAGPAAPCQREQGPAQLPRRIGW